MSATTRRGRRRRAARCCCFVAPFENPRRSSAIPPRRPGGGFGGSSPAARSPSAVSDAMSISCCSSLQVVDAARRAPFRSGVGSGVGARQPRPLLVVRVRSRNRAVTGAPDERNLRNRPFAPSRRREPLSAPAARRHSSFGLRETASRTCSCTAQRSSNEGLPTGSLTCLDRRAACGWRARPSPRRRPQGRSKNFTDSSSLPNSTPRRSRPQASRSTQDQSRRHAGRA